MQQVAVEEVKMIPLSEVLDGMNRHGRRTFYAKLKKARKKYPDAEYQEVVKETLLSM